jgi:hypothetical protein
MAGKWLHVAGDACIVGWYLAVIFTPCQIWPWASCWPNSYRPSQAMMSLFAKAELRMLLRVHRIACCFPGSSKPIDSKEKEEKSYLLNLGCRVLASRGRPRLAGGDIRVVRLARHLDGRRLGLLTASGWIGRCKAVAKRAVSL